MTITAGHDRLTAIADDVRQLVDPITIPVAQRPRGGRTQWHAVQHPPLLDQLRAATQPGAGQRGPERRPHPGSRPPLRVDAVDTLAGIYVGITWWNARLRLASPPRDTDWQKHTLRQLAAAAPSLAPAIADQLADDINAWWSACARTCGWRTEELRNAR